MSLIFGCIDSDVPRREAAMKGFAERVRRVDGLIHGGFSNRDFSLGWGASSLTPLHACKAADGRAAIVVGAIVEARDQGNPSGNYLLEVSGAKGASAISGLNGFYMGVVQQPGDELWVATDCLGYFPVYWWSRGDVFVFASAPGLIRHHPSFSPVPSALGIAGILMTTHLVDNQTIWQGVKRLAAGSLISWRRERGAVLQPGRTLEMGTTRSELTPSDALDLLHETLSAAVKSATQRQVSLMLSGGLDSRLVAAYATKIALLPPPSVTFGRPGDLEVHCARAVARSLRIPHHIAPEDFDAFTRDAEFHSELERSSNSLLNLMWCTGAKVFATLGRPVLTGFLGDVVMGLSHVGWAWTPTTGRHEFDAFWNRARRYGVSTEQLRRLLRKEFFGDAIDEITEMARAAFEGYAGKRWQQAWMFDLLHRQRFHICPHAWRLSLSVWAETPFADLRLLQVVPTLPFEFLQGRRAQRNLLAQKFERLARLPLDTNSSHLRPILGTFTNRALAKIQGSSWIGRILHGQRERRTYYRIYDVNNAGWTGIRHRAETSRRLLEEWFDRTTLNEVMPAPHIRLNPVDGIVDSSGAKTLVTLALSLRDLG